MKKNKNLMQIFGITMILQTYQVHSMMNGMTSNQVGQETTPLPGEKVKLETLEFFNLIQLYNNEADLSPPQGTFEEIMKKVDEEVKRIEGLPKWNVKSITMEIIYIRNVIIKNTSMANDETRKKLASKLLQLLKFVKGDLDAVDQIIFNVDICNLIEQILRNTNISQGIEEINDTITKLFKTSVNIFIKKLLKKLSTKTDISIFLKKTKEISLFLQDMMQMHICQLILSVSNKPKEQKVKLLTSDVLNEIKTMIQEEETKEQEKKKSLQKEIITKLEEEITKELEKITREREENTRLKEMMMSEPKQ